MTAAPALRGRDLVLVLVIVVVWAVNFLTSARGLREIPPLLFTALRFGLLLLPLALLMKRPGSGQWGRLLAVSLCVGVVHFSLSFVALKLAGDLSSPAIVLQSYVPMTTLLAWWWLGEKVGWRTATAIALSFMGVLVLGFDPHVLERPLALAAMLASAFALAVGTILMKGFADRYVLAAGLDGGVQPAAAALLSLWLEPGALAACRRQRHRVAGRRLCGVRVLPAGPWLYSAGANGIPSRRSRRGCCWCRCWRSCWACVLVATRPAHACCSVARWCWAGC